MRRARLSSSRFTRRVVVLAMVLVPMAALGTSDAPPAEEPRQLQQQPATRSLLQPGITVAYQPSEGYKGQEGQDKWINENFFHSKRNGVFVDLGCYDGITYSNTWYFEAPSTPPPHTYTRYTYPTGILSASSIGPECASSQTPRFSLG